MWFWLHIHLLTLKTHTHNSKRKPHWTVLWLVKASVLTFTQLSLKRYLTCLEEFKFCMPSPEAIPPRVWLGSALFERGSFRLGEGKNGEVVGSSTRPPSWLKKERVSCVQCPDTDSAQNSFPWKYSGTWMNKRSKYCLKRHEEYIMKSMEWKEEEKEKQN